MVGDTSKTREEFNWVLGELPVVGGGAAEGLLVVGRTVGGVVGRVVGLLVSFLLGFLVGPRVSRRVGLPVVGVLVGLPVIGLPETGVKEGATL